VPGLPRKRTSRPRYQVLATVIGELQPGHVYLVTYPKERDRKEYVEALARSLSRFNKAFDPPARFLIICEDKLVYDLSGQDVGSLARSGGT
jgi:hypothetical protein